MATKKERIYFHYPKSPDGSYPSGRMMFKPNDTLAKMVYNIVSAPCSTKVIFVQFDENDKEITHKEAMFSNSVGGGERFAVWLKSLRMT